MFITLEGGEGTGKSTQLARLRAWLEARGATVVVTREPGGTPLAEAVRAILLDPEFRPDGLTEIFLLAAARHDHVENVVRPALEAGAVVLCDRFTDSSLVYQGVVREVGVDEVARLNALATSGLEPNLTLVLDADPVATLTRARSRNQCTGSSSRLDDEPTSFHEQVGRAFRELADRYPERVRVIDASGDETAVFARVLAALPGELR
jgi:dTMP kinase